MQIASEMRRRHPFFPIYLTYFVDNFGLAIIFPIFTPLLLSYTAPFLEKTLFLGLLIASFPFAQFFGAPLIGQFSDRFGRKLSFYITIVGTAFGYVFTAACILHGSLLGLFLSRLFTGFFAGNLTLCLASIADMSHDDVSRAKNFGQIGAIGGLSFIIAIAFGGLFSNPTLSHLFNPSVPFWITALLSFLNLVCVIYLFQETHPPQRHPGINPFRGFNNLLIAIKLPELRTLYSVNFLFMFAWVGTIQFLPSFLLHTEQYSSSVMTLFLIGIGVFWSITNLFINPLLAKWTFPGRTLLFSLLILALLLSAILFASKFLIFFFPAVCLASLCWTNGLATISLKAPSFIQGSILGINQSVNSVAAMLSPAIGGVLAGLTKHGFFLISWIMVFAAFFILLQSKAYRHHHKKEKP